MIEKFFYKADINYELFIQVTDYTAYVEVITIIHHNNNWREDRTQYKTNEYNQLIFPNTYQTIEQSKFDEAQNEILKVIGKTKSELKELYYGLWHTYLVDRLRIEEFLIASQIDLTNHWLVSQFRQQKEFEMELHKKREAIHAIFLKNNPSIISNEDIFNKVSSLILEKYLKRRAEIQSKS